MDKPFYVGMYATSPTLFKWNEALERDYVNSIKEFLPNISGLELPFWGNGIHQYSDDFLKSHYKKEWDYVMACVPGNMNELSKDPHFGLASDNNEGRAKAIQFYKKANEAVLSLNHWSEKKSVKNVQIVTSPSTPHPEVSSSKESLLKSLNELLSWDWNGSKLTIEHCDHADKEGNFIKGFLSIEDEISAIEQINNPQLGITINWGRSALEGKSSAHAISHLKLATKKEVLKGMMFSGTCLNSSQYGSFQDNHAPVKNDHQYSEATSLLDENQMIESFKSIDLNSLDYLGMKILSMPMDSSTLEQRIGVNLSAYTSILKTYQQVSQGN